MKNKIGSEGMELYYKGASMDVIAKVVGIGASSVRRLFISAGLPIKRTERPTKPTEEVQATYEELLLNVKTLRKSLGICKRRKYKH